MTGPLPPERWSDAPTRYPDIAVKILDPRFGALRLFNAAVERLATGFRWVEGPVWFGDHGCLVFSDIPSDRLLRWDAVTGKVSVFRSPAGFANGNARDAQGRLITCEHLGRRLTRTEYDGSLTVLADGYQGKPLNAPSDVALGPDGSVWFTDPGHGIMNDYEGRRATAELPTAVYRLAPGHALEQAVTSLVHPNGLCFSPDGLRLYVVDSAPESRNIHVFDLDGGRLVGGRTFASLEPGTADGIRCDVHGNVWAATGGGGEDYDGVHVFASDGTRIGQILLPEISSNLCFAGPARNRLIVTASQSLYAIYLNTAGL